ncbi:MAG: HlyD family secretion protein [Motiliproteus sp.]|jgi:HlyD family secretion protein
MPRIYTAFSGSLAAIAIASAIWWNSRPQPVMVDTVRVERGQVERSLVNTRAGTVKACRRAQLSLAIGGQIALLAISEGDYVKKDQLLIELWNEDLKASLEQTRRAAQSLHLEQAAICIRAHNAQREADRIATLLVRKMISEERADQTQAEAAAIALSCRAAGARKQEAEARIAMAEAALERTRLRAPFAGIVAEISGKVGEYATPSPPGVPTPPAIDLLTDDCHYIEAPIDEVDAAELSPGQPLRIELDAYRGQRFAGTLRRIAPYVLDLEKQARTVTVEAEFSRPPGIRLLAGYSADLEIILQNRADTLRIPSEALLNERYVLLYQEGQPLSQREVKTGLSNWRYTEILSGLVAGDQIVSSLGRSEIRAGALAVTVTDGGQ